MSHLQLLLLADLKDTLLNSLHGQAGKFTVSSRRMQEMRQENYFPSIASHIRKWVRECQNCVQNKKN